MRRGDTEDGESLMERVRYKEMADLLPLCGEEQTWK
jgi:hypothetical protein